MRHSKKLRVRGGIWPGHGNHPLLDYGDLMGTAIKF